MSAAAMRGVVRQLGSSADPPPDADLVTAFAVRRDADAFAALVARHGPTVLGVCQRLLGDAHDAEDAFQAVFLVLARKVKAVRPPGAVGGWLFGVAVRTANKARVAAARRRRREMIAASNSARRERERPRDSRELAELRAALDAELAKLPETLRAVVVLCDLHGRSRAEAAAELGCPEGTVAARLHRARKKLGEALARCGLALPAAGLGVAFVPASVSAAAIRSAVAAALGSARPVVLALAREVTRSMSATTHAIALGAIGAIALLAGGLLAGGNLGSGEAAAPPSLAEAKEVKVEQPAPKTPPSPWKEVKVLNLSGWLAGSMAYSADGKMLVIGGTGGFVRAYSTAALKQLWEYQGMTDYAAVAVSPDDKSVAVTFKDADRRWGIRLLNAATGKLELTLDEGGVPGVVGGPEPFAVGFFPDVPLLNAPGSTSHKVIYGTAGEYVVKTWVDPENASTIKSSTVAAGKKPADRFAVPLAVDPGGKRVVVTGPIDRATGKNVLWAWSAGSGVGNKLLEGHKAIVVSAAWSKDGKWIVTGDADGTVITWDAATFKEKSRLKFDGRVVAVAVSPDGKHTAAAVVGPSKENKTNTAGEVFVWPMANVPQKPEPIHSNLTSTPFVGTAGLAFAPDGKSLAFCLANFTNLMRTSPLIGHVKVFEVAPIPPEKPAAPPGYVQDAGLSPDGKRYLVLKGAQAHVHDTATGKVLYSIAAEAARFTADGKSLMVMGAKAVLECDAATGKILKQQPRPQTKLGWHLVSFSPDGTRYAAHFGFNVRIYDTTTGRESVELDNQHEPGSSTLPATVGKQLVWSPDGKQLAAVGVLVDEGKMGMAGWDVASGKRLYSFAADFTDGPRAVAFSADSKAIGIGYEKRIDVWTGGLNPVKKLGEQGLVTALAFTPDGKSIAAGIRLPILHGGEKVPRIVGHKTEVRLIDIATDKVVKVFDGFEGVNHMAATKLPVTALAFSPDGKKLLAGTGILNVTALPPDVPKAGELKVFDLVPPDGASRPLENAALRKFQGAWKLDGFDLGGGNTLSDEEVNHLGWILTIEGNKFQMADKDGKGTSSGRIAVDDSQKPPVLIRIETDREQDVYTWCLYELDGDTLRLCQDVHQKGKPKEFKATADTTIATYKRIKK